ncbi:MAG: methionyl-tRNA formyltransferase [Candidatus Omnitrophica bacterium]|nr:methionyl-tRNA formyltransferase [Candidatus Omnitrophota bacterium]
MRVLFFGSSNFSIPVLEALHKAHQVIAVISTPDEKKGRGQIEGPTPVKAWALQHGLECLTPEKLKAEDFLAAIKLLKPELGVIASYGKLVPDSLLAISSVANLNVHPSLLPQYRGASPIQSAILHGDTVTGVSIMRPVAKMDAGDVLIQKSLAIGPDENAEELSVRLSQLGAELLLEGIQVLEKNPNSNFHIQDDKLATLCGKITKEDGLFTWNDPASLIHRKIRAFVPWPVAHTHFANQPLRIFKSELGDPTPSEKPPGTLLATSKHRGFLIQTGEGSLWILQVQQAGKNIVNGFQFLMGQRLKEGMSLTA